MNNNIHDIFISERKSRVAIWLRGGGEGAFGGGEPNFKTCIVNGDSRLRAQPSRRICLAICAAV